MRWPWQKRAESRDIGGSGNFSDQVIRLIESQAATKAADAGSTAAVEAAAGALSRAFASAEVEAAPWVQEIVTPDFLALTARNWIRSGASMHVIEVDRGGRVELLPGAFWNFEGGARRRDWSIRVTSYGPSSSETRLVPFDAIIFTTWGTSPGTPYVGTGPLGWASTTARLQSEAERSLADEAAGPLAQLLTYPEGAANQDADGDEGDTLAPIRAAIAAARGKAFLVESTASGYGEGKQNAPRRDWEPRRLGPSPPDAMTALRKDAFEAVLAATGTPPSLFLDSDGTSQREAVRRWHMNVVLPMARVLEHELTMKLEAEVRLRFDGYAMDLVSRAQVVAKLVAAGVPVMTAMAAVGLAGE